MHCEQQVTQTANFNITNITTAWFVNMIINKPKEFALLALCVTTIVFSSRGSGKFTVRFKNIPV